MNCLGATTVLHYLVHKSSVSEVCRDFLSDSSLNGVFGVSAGAYFTLFGLTLLVEAPVYYLFLRRRLSLEKFFFAVLFLNIATHPLVILGLPQFFALASFPKIGSIVTAELFAPTFEGLILWKGFDVPPRTAWTTAFIANIFSWTVGGYLPIPL